MEGSLLIILLHLGEYVKHLAFEHLVLLVPMSDQHVDQVFDTASESTDSAEVQLDIPPS